MKQIVSLTLLFALALSLCACGGGADPAALELLDPACIGLINREKAHIQDPYSFRCIPQVYGASKDSINYVSYVFRNEINSVTDNPTIFPEEDMIISAGNFHGQPLALALDNLAIAMSELGNISERRTYQLLSGTRDLPPFLVANPGLNSGFMIPQYTAASMVSHNKQLCTPSSVDSIESSQGQEDHVSMGANAATSAWRVMLNLERILAIELYNAAQAMEFRRPARSSSIMESFLEQYLSARKLSSIRKVLIRKMLGLYQNESGSSQGKTLLKVIFEKLTSRKGNQTNSPAAPKTGSNL